MSDYQELYEYLGLPPAAVKLGLGRIKPPSLIFRAPFRCYGFPPALLPLWSNGSDPSYDGYWKHWFVARQLTIVDYSVEEGRAYEIARDLEQLVWAASLTEYDSPEAREEVKRFAREMEIEGIESLDELTSSLPEALRVLPAFGANSPLECYSDDEAGYTGDFPHDRMILTEENVRNICTIEASEQLKARIAALPFGPAWFKSKDQEPVFYDCLHKDDHGGAWMSLNSHGWRYERAKTAILELAERVNHQGFTLLANCWTSQPHEEAGGF